MTTLTLPIPWFGGKRRAAPLIWAALGDPGHYIEPFAGSAAGLLGRPAAHTGARETLNDSDGMIANALRAIRSSPAEVAEHCQWPLVEVDVHARLAWLHDRSRDPDWVAWLEGDPDHSDARAAGWWLYVTAASIGYPLGAPGSWHRVDGRLRRLPGTPGGCQRSIPSVGEPGSGIFAQHLRPAGGVDRLMTRLAARLRHVRITCGDWRRVLTPTLLRPEVRRGGDPATGILLDPPYAVSGDIYAQGDATVSTEVRAWCLTADPDLRIVLCGYDTEHDELLPHGWTVTEGRAGSGAGRSTRSDNGRRERLWLSPACTPPAQDALFPTHTERTTP